MTTALLAPPLACAVTLLAFVAARRLAMAARRHPLANPILLAALMVGGLLWAADVPLDAYERASWPLRWALGPAVVALGALVHDQRAALRASALPLLASVVAGSLVGILSAVGLARLARLDEALVMALSAKSVTSPFAIALMERLGGPAPLAAGLVIVTGIVGAILLPPLLDRLGFDRPEAMGAAMGQAAHVVGTDAMMRRDARAAAFAGLAMTLAGIATAILLPLIWPLLR